MCGTVGHPLNYSTIHIFTGYVNLMEQAPSCSSRQFKVTPDVQMIRKGGILFEGHRVEAA